MSKVCISVLFVDASWFNYDATVYAVRKTKSQGFPEQPDPVYAEVQPESTDTQLKMRMNIAVEKFEMGKNVAYGCSAFGH